jgi:hypothetical protein
VTRGERGERGEREGRERREIRQWRQRRDKRGPCLVGVQALPLRAPHHLLVALVL